MARPIPDERIEQERRKMMAHQDEFFGNSLLSPLWNRRKSKLALLVIAVACIIYATAYLLLMMQHSLVGR